MKLVVCDSCRKEIDEEETVRFSFNSMSLRYRILAGPMHDSFDLCQKCSLKFIKIIKKSLIKEE